MDMYDMLAAGIPLALFILIAIIVRFGTEPEEDIKFEDMGKK